MRIPALLLALATSTVALWACTSSSTSGNGPSPGCTDDTECADDEVCEDGECVEIGGDGSGHNGTTTSTGSSTGSGVPSSAKDICGDYLTCLAAAYPSGVAEALAAYGPEGSCWGGDPQIEEACGTACREQMKSWHDSAPESCPECFSSDDCAGGACDAGSCAGPALGVPGQDATCNVCRDEAVKDQCAQQAITCAQNESCVALATCLAHCESLESNCASNCFDQDSQGYSLYQDYYYCVACGVCYEQCPVCGLS
jgi:hypothetical protein